MKLKIRKATVKDLDIVAELFRKHLKELKKFEPSLKVGTKKEAKKAVRGWGKHTKYFVILVAEANGEIVGFVNGMTYRHSIRNKREGFVNNTYVLPEYRRKGIATKLLTSIIKKFKMRNLTMCTLDAYVKNKKAISLWKKMGFETDMINFKKRI